MKNKKLLSAVSSFLSILMFLSVFKPVLVYANNRDGLSLEYVLVSEYEVLGKMGQVFYMDGFYHYFVQTESYVIAIDLHVATGTISMAYRNNETNEIQTTVLRQATARIALNPTQIFSNLKHQILNAAIVFDEVTEWNAPNLMPEMRNDAFRQRGRNALSAIGVNERSRRHIATVNHLGETARAYETIVISQPNGTGLRIFGTILAGATMAALAAATGQPQNVVRAAFITVTNVAGIIVTANNVTPRTMNFNVGTFREGFVTTYRNPNRVWFEGSRGQSYVVVFGDRSDVAHLIGTSSQTNWGDGSFIARRAIERATGVNR